ncbi:MAG: hypothetical protein V1773_17065 [bacterium]
MSVIERLSALNNKNNNLLEKELAAELLKTKNKTEIQELVINLDNKNKKIQSNCIKTLYELGEMGGGGLIAEYCENFGGLLVNKNNRLVWGAVTALNTIAAFNPEGVYKLLNLIIKAVDQGSVITIDNGVGIYSQLAVIPQYEKESLFQLFKILDNCPIKQFPMYIEKSEKCINKNNVQPFINIIKKRFENLEKDTQKKRVSKMLNKINKL